MPTMTFIRNWRGWSVGHWDKGGKWVEYSTHGNNRTAAFAALQRLNAMERVNVSTDASPSDHVPTGSIMADSPH